MQCAQTPARQDRRAPRPARRSARLVLTGALLALGAGALSVPVADAAQPSHQAGTRAAGIGVRATPDTCHLRSFTRAASGHFDLGPTLNGSTVVPAVKDDRKQPARWGQPAQFLFELGDSARRRLPAGLGFIAPAGTPVHMIGATQESSVPWLGWNTQHPSLLAQAASEVRMTLVSVRGPGNVAVFTSGTFGQAVGQRIFDTVGGPRSATVPLNTHAHGNWVFTRPGA